MRTAKRLATFSGSRDKDIAQRGSDRGGRGSRPTGSGHSTAARFYLYKVRRRFVISTEAAPEAAATANDEWGAACV